MIFAYFEYLGYKSRFYGVMVSTLDFESSDPSSNLGRTCQPNIKQKVNANATVTD